MGLYTFLMRTVDFYFDPVSPYVWLSATQVPRVEKTFGVKFRFVPVLFAGLLEASGQKGPAETPAKRIYTIRDALRWATQYGRCMQGPPAHPFVPLASLRVCAAIDDDAQRARVATAICISTWEKGLDITRTDTLTDVLKACKVDAAATLARAETQEIKDRLRANTAQAVERGVFGVPTFTIDDQLFWGNDRIPLLESYLAGNLRVDETHLALMLARPRAADRKGITY